MLDFFLFRFLALGVHSLISVNVLLVHRTLLVPPNDVANSRGIRGHKSCSFCEKVRPVAHPTGDAVFFVSGPAASYVPSRAYSGGHPKKNLEVDHEDFSEKIQ